MKRIFLVIVSVLINISVFGQITAKQAIVKMGRGINIGNSLDAYPTEISWGNPLIQKYYFDDFANAGFSCIRIPITWKDHVQKNTPYTINPAWMARVDTVVTWGLNKGLFIIINLHHEVGFKAIDTMKNLTAKADTIAKYDSIWSQISTHFKNKSDHLLFEILNEPYPMSQTMVDSFNSNAYRIIRKTNPTRVIIFSGNVYSNSDQLVVAKIPNPKDSYLMGYYHSYDPWSFAGQGIGTYGSSSDISTTIAKFSQVTTWSVKNNIPVTLDEFGALINCDYNSRMLYLATVVEQSLNYNIAYNYWDDNGTFQVYNRSKRTWDDAKDVLIHYSKLSPNQLKIVPNDTTLTFTWSNRTALNDSIFIDRRISESSFMPIAKLKYNTTQFHDSALSRNTVYYYRIRTQLNDTIALYSYPVSINVAPQLGTRKPYLGQTIPVPGTIQAEDFDLGGQGVAYNDIATTNQGGAYRTTENVGIEARPDSGYQLDYVSDGEWTSYTINCTQKGLYRIDTYAASLNGGGTYYFRVGKDSSKAITVPKTGDWTTLAVSKTYQFNLDTGAQVLYFIIAKGTSNPYNIDKFIIVPDSSAAVNIISKNLDQIMLYPNPASSEVIVQSVNSNQLHLDIFDILGNKLMTEILTNDRNIISTYGLSNGLYIFVVTSKNTTTVERIIIRK